MLKLNNAMKRILLFSACLILLLPLSAQHHDSSEGTSATLDSILSAIEHNNLQLQSLRHSHEAEVLDLKAENTLSGPTVEYSPFYQKGYPGLASSELIISEEVDFPTQYAQRRRQANLQAETLSHAYSASRRDVLLQSQLLCLDIIRLNQLSDLLRQRLSQSETMLTLFEKRMEAGDANILALNKAKLERLDVLKASAQTESERMELLQALQALNGGKPIAVTAMDFPERRLDSDFDAFMQRSLSSDADILSAQASAKASDHSLAMSRQSWLPSISVGYRRNTEQHESLNGFMVGASFPLFSTSSAVKAAKQRQLSAQLQLDEVRQQAESELRTRYAELLRLRSVLDHSDTDLLRETLTLLGKALQQGEISALEYYTEVSDIYEKFETHINLHCQYSKLLAQLYKSEL